MRKLTMAELGRPDVGDFGQQAKTPVCLLLDGVRSALNVGSCFRTADAFALEGLHLCGITAQPPHKEILKTALGATQSVAWHYHADAAAALAGLKAEGYTLLAVEQTDASQPLQAYPLRADGRYVLVLGNEVSGVSEAALALCEAAIEIPQAGTKHSLNVAVCAGIAAWHFYAGLRL